MPTAECQKNINEKKSFPACTDAYCNSVSFALGVHCTKAVPPLDPDTPVGPQMDPNLNGPGKAGYCYCCCSCFATNTPIEVSPGVFELAGEIRSQDQIMVAGTDLKWVPRKVQIASTWNPTGGLVPSMYFVRYAYSDGAEQTREVIVSPDHLFLMEDGKLLAVQHLKKTPLKLRRADGGLAEVLVVALGSFSGGISSLSMGDFNGKDLAGHLINSNGIVSADFAVQAYYAASSLNANLMVSLPPEKEKLAMGTAEYHAEAPDAAYSAFVQDPSQWPEGFSPVRRREINPPPDASSFLTRAQAEDIRKRAPQGTPSNTYPARALLYLFNEARGFYPNVTFLLDWENALPNAYSWTEWGRQMVVITGGLVRVQALGRDGLSLILSAMISYQSNEVSCVGEADYAGVGFVMHDLWEDNLFVTVVDKALPQVTELFGFIGPAHRKGNPDDPCKQPSIDCRLDAYKAALMFYPVPDCAKPKPDYFDVQDARAVDATTVQIKFSRDLNAPTAETVTNYAFTPAAQVNAAKLDPNVPSQVVLTVLPLDPATSYLVKVSNVVSNDGVLLDPHQDTGAFTTK